MIGQTYCAPTAPATLIRRTAQLTDERTPPRHSPTNSTLRRKYGY
ncbi:hypothetical protein [Fibrivirga algicola]|nr:hypothetical protein [Fibrivirga algicola]